MSHTVTYSNKNLQRSEVRDSSLYLSSKLQSSTEWLGRCDSMWHVSDPRRGRGWTRRPPGATSRAVRSGWFPGRQARCTQAATLGGDPSRMSDFLEMGRNTVFLGWAFTTLQLQQLPTVTPTPTPENVSTEIRQKYPRSSRQSCWSCIVVKPATEEDTIPAECTEVLSPLIPHGATSRRRQVYRSPALRMTRYTDAADALPTHDWSACLAEVRSRVPAPIFEDFPCRTCGAPPGLPCTGRKEVHAPRYDRWRNVKRDYDLDTYEIACIVCERAYGRPPARARARMDLLIRLSAEETPSGRRTTP